MAERLNEENNQLNESFTEFGAPKPGMYNPRAGTLRSWFAKFFARPGRPIAKGDRLAGDTVKTVDTFEGFGAGISISRGLPRLPQIEYDRKKRYKEYEDMDEYPEIGAGLDIYADDGTQKNIEGIVIEINTDHEVIRKTSEDFFKTIRMDDYIWDIARNVCKYGDCFLENIVDLNNPNAGIQRIKVLNPNYILRVENEYGYLKNFLQEVPDMKKSGSFDSQSFGEGRTEKYIPLDKEQVVHFRVHTSDPNFYPYGKSILAPGVRAWKSLKLMEDAMLIYRLSRAPERRVFYIDTGNLPTSKVESFMERVKQKFRKEKFFNPSTGGIDERYNPISTDEDFFVPVKGREGTKIDVLPGAQNLGEVDDVKYFRDKLLAAMKVPKDYVVEKDKSPERKANLAQLDVKFARAVTRIQREVETGLVILLKRHLHLKKFAPSLINSVDLALCTPSDMFEKRRLELDDQKIRVVQAIKGLELFPSAWIMKTYFQMSDSEIETLKSEMKEELQEQAELEQELAPEPPPGMPPMGGGMPPEGMEGVEEEVPEEEEAPEPV